MQKRIYELGQEGSSCQNWGIHIHTFDGRKNMNVCVDDLSYLNIHLSQKNLSLYQHLYGQGLWYLWG